MIIYWINQSFKDPWKTTRPADLDIQQLQMRSEPLVSLKCFLVEYLQLFLLSVKVRTFVSSQDHARVEADSQGSFSDHCKVVRSNLTLFLLYIILAV